MGPRTGAAKPPAVFCVIWSSSSPQPHQHDMTGKPAARSFGCTAACGFCAARAAILQAAGAAIYPDRLKLCPAPGPGSRLCLFFFSQIRACLARYCTRPRDVYWAWSRDFPIGAHPCRAPCKSGYRKPRPGPRLSLPERAAIGGPGPCAFSFCVAPSNPSRSPCLGLALGWRGGAAGCSGTAGARSVPRPRPPSSRRRLGAKAWRCWAAGPLTAGAGQLQNRVSQCRPHSSLTRQTLGVLPLSEKLRALLIVACKSLSRSQQSQAHAARQQPCQHG